jgi:DnaJ-class molecular chaperone
MRLKGYGLPQMKRDQRGDLYARIVAKIPKTLNKKQKSLVQELSKVGL